MRWSKTAALLLIRSGSYIHSFMETLRGLVKPRNPYGRWPMPPSRVTVSPFMYLKSGPQS